MDEQTMQMFAAFHLATHRADLEDGASIVDVAVANAGNRLFGEGWTPYRISHSLAYAPLVSMALGRMQVAGLVRAGETRAGGSARYRSWTFTDEGRALAEEVFGPAESLLA